MPKFSVIRFEKSPEMSHSVAGGMSAVLDHDTVGIDISSATQGSSVASVAGRKRAPTKQCASASEVNANAIKLASTNENSVYRDIRITPVRKREKLRAALKAALHHALSGGPLGRATEYRENEDRRSGCAA